MFIFIYVISDGKIHVSRLYVYLEKKIVYSVAILLNNEFNISCSIATKILRENRVNR